MELPPYEELKYLADEHPEKLESLRRRLVEETIGSAPEELRQRLRGLQFRIDAERRRASNPLSACLRLSAMMNDSLHAMLDALTGEPAVRPQPVSATIIPFPLLTGS
ncbi:MAG: DUF3135 domain-containing protein [Pseudomonadota bacterium]|nr:DUF3135 domain-containing protein [Pseudomonadota bacterium]